MTPSSQDILQVEKSGVVATLLFCDAVGYAKLAADASPENLIRQLSAYMKTVSAELGAHRGTIAKFVGDAVFAYWLEDEHADHAKLACQFAANIQERLAAASVNFETRIGIHTGRVALVRINGGSYRSLEPMGDAVNLAVRLDGVCGEYKARAIASEQVIAHGGGGAGWTVLEFVTVKGRTTPLTLYKLA